MKTGSCLWRAVTFELHGQLRPIEKHVFEADKGDYYTVPHGFE